MKTILSVILCSILTMTLFAQSPANQQNIDKSKQFVNVRHDAHSCAGRENPSSNVTPTPYLKLELPSGNYIGETNYELISNRSMRNCLTAFPDGTAAAVWTMSSTVNTTRGTGYNYFDGSQWLPIPDKSSDRLESVYSGWGVHAALGAGEIVASHTNVDGLNIGIRDTKGTGTWNFQTLVGPELVPTLTDQVSHALLWPTIATVGDTIHIFACTESDTVALYQGMQTALVYYRSCDRGQTWDINAQIIGNLTAQELERVSGDGYSLVAKHGILALACGGTFGDVFFMKSTDGGASWTKNLVYPSYVPADFDWTNGYFDTCYLNDGAIAIDIDDNGLIHMAFGTKKCLRNEENNADEYSLFQYSPIMIYYNETMGTLTPVTWQNVETFTNFITVSDLNNNGEFGLRMATLPEYSGLGDVSQPQIIAEGGKVYLFYSAVLEDPFYSVDDNKNYRGIFATKSDDNGASWDANQVSWLSYHPSLMYVEEFEEWNDSTIYLSAESENAFPITAKNIVDGKIHVMWFSDPIADVNSSSPFTQYTVKVFHMAIDADDVGTYCNTNEIFDGTWNQIGISENNKPLYEMKTYPNPASDELNIVLHSTENITASLSIANIMGQVVYSENAVVQTGSNNYSLNVSNLVSGLYFVTFQTAHGTSTQKFIVK
ncbi:MAG: T9SS type A sorting domain-containing protein [Bacteroidales bacterium]|jgi:hypothetical protein|nr:T9SS type A sorting domain-containing protein [Bacteroidales bacterium]MDD4394936.1 T9SS type A sorting domain-containing protein [Bacteroidales bacterium]